MMSVSIRVALVVVCIGENLLGMRMPIVDSAGMLMVCLVGGGNSTNASVTDVWQHHDIMNMNVNAYISILGCVFVFVMMNYCNMAIYWEQLDCIQCD